MINNLRNSHVIFWPILICAVIFSFFDTIEWMYGRYTNPDSYYSHGFLVPFVTAWLIWQNRNIKENQTLTYTKWGAGIILFALILHILGTAIYVFSVSGFSIFFLIIGIALFIYGGQFVRDNLAPLLFLLFMFPVPQAFITKFSFPLKMFVAEISAYMIGLTGIPIYREGFNIIIPAGNLLVGNPCSGIRSLLAFMALGFVFAYLSNTTKIKKIIIFIMSIPVAIFSNLIRVPFLILIANFLGLEAASPESVLHNASGIFTFILGLLMILFIGRAFEWKK